MQVRHRLSADANRIGETRALLQWIVFPRETINAFIEIVVFNNRELYRYSFD